MEAEWVDPKVVEKERKRMLAWNRKMSENMLESHDSVYWKSPADKQEAFKKLCVERSIVRRAYSAWAKVMKELG